MFSARDLVLLRQKALRKKVWFKVLSQLDRGLVSLTIRCVDHVRSSKLVAMLRNITERLRQALRGKVERLMVEVGWSLSRKIAYLAASWGNRDALNWAFDCKFARYLTVARMNDSGMFKG